VVGAILPVSDPSRYRRDARIVIWPEGRDDEPIVMLVRSGPGVAAISGLDFKRGFVSGGETCVLTSRRGLFAGARVRVDSEHAPLR
jgi:hypothetical protein